MYFIGCNFVEAVGKVLALLSYRSREVIHEFSEPQEPFVLSIGHNGVLHSTLQFRLRVYVYLEWKWNGITWAVIGLVDGNILQDGKLDNWNECCERS